MFTLLNRAGEGDDFGTEWSGIGDSSRKSDLQYLNLVPPVGSTVWVVARVRGSVPEPAGGFVMAFNCLTRKARPVADER